MEILVDTPPPPFWCVEGFSRTFPLFLAAVQIADQGEGHLTTRGLTGKATGSDRLV